MTTPKEHYVKYFRADPLDWEYLGITHEQLMEDNSLYFEEGINLLTDSQLGAKIRRTKEEDAIEGGDEKCFYMPDYTTQELGEAWRRDYQESWLIERAIN